MAVPLQDSPLAPEELKRQARDAVSHCFVLGSESLHAELSVSASIPVRTFARRVSDSVMGFVHAARELQTAYITAISIGASSDPLARSRDDVREEPVMQLRVEGCRAMASDVKKFTTPDSMTEVVEETFDSIPRVSPR